MTTDVPTGLNDSSMTVDGCLIMRSIYNRKSWVKLDLELLDDRSDTQTYN